MSGMSTVQLTDISNQPWDVIILGAGPAGAAAAIHLAREKLRVLLCDKASFPRNKVCGGCLNAQSLAHLQSIGIEKSDLLESGALATGHLRLFSSAGSARLDLPEGIAIPRAELDRIVVERAIQCGVAFLDAARATISSVNANCVEVSLQAGKTPAITATARIALIATGLSSRPVPATFDWIDRVEANSRIGAGTIIDATQVPCPAGELRMICGAHGYIGLANIGNGNTNIAAVIDPDFVKVSGGLPQAVRAVFAEAAYDAFIPTNITFGAVPTLTRSLARVAFPRLFILGDSAGYIEPFTGQGMAWAYHCAKLGSPIVEQAVQSWDDKFINAWQHLYQQKIRREQKLCSMIKEILRRPWLTNTLIRVFANIPAMAGPLVRSATGLHLLEKDLV